MGLLLLLFASFPVSVHSVSKNVCMAGFCDYKKKRKEEEEEEEEEGGGGGGVGMPKLVQYGQRLGKGDAPNYNIRWWPLFSRK